MLCEAGDEEEEEVLSLLTAPNTSGDTPLHVACEANSLDVVKYIVLKLELADEAENAAATLNNMRLAPVHVCVVHGSTDVLSYLLGDGGDGDSWAPHNLVDVNLPGLLQLTPLHLSSMCLSGGPLGLRTTLLLLSAGARPSDLQPGTRISPLHFACARGREAMPIVDVLVRREPELLNAKDRYGYSPMHVAAINGHFVVGMGLGVRGARVGGRDDAGDDVLDVCARRGHGRFLEYAAAVLKRQQQGEEEEEEEWGERLGKTLKIAIEAGEVKAVEVLLRAGASTKGNELDRARSRARAESRSANVVDGFGEAEVEAAAEAEKKRIIVEMIEKHEEEEALFDDQEAETAEEEAARLLTGFGGGGGSYKQCENSSSATQKPWTPTQAANSFKFKAPAPAPKPPKKRGVVPHWESGGLVMGGGGDNSQSQSQSQSQSERGVKKPKFRSFAPFENRMVSLVSGGESVGF